MIRIIGLANTNLTAIMDDADYQALPGYRYYPDSLGYVQAVPPGKGFEAKERLHILVMGKQPRGVVVDHIDGNPLNNTRQNLRAVSPSVNGGNRKRLNTNNKTGIRGVYYVTAARFALKPWLASLVVNGRNKYLGMHATKEEAAAARRHGELKYYGEHCPETKAS